MINKRDRRKGIEERQTEIEGNSRKEYSCKLHEFKLTGNKVEGKNCGRSTDGNQRKRE